MVQEEQERGGVRKFRLRSEAPMHAVRRGQDAVGRIGNDRRRRLSRRGLIQVFGQCLPERRGLTVHIGAVGLPHLVNPFEDLAEGGPPIGGLRRKVGATEKELGVGSQETGERPASLPGDGLDAALVARVHVRPLVAVHFDADEVPVQEIGKPGVFVGLGVHHVAPVAPHRADVEENRPAGAPGQLERLLTPGMPLHRLVGGGTQVGRGRIPQPIGAHAQS